jgi:hypothetical protein
MNEDDQRIATEGTVGSEKNGFLGVLAVLGRGTM